MQLKITQFCLLQQWIKLMGRCKRDQQAVWFPRRRFRRWGRRAQTPSNPSPSPSPVLSTTYSIFARKIAFCCKNVKDMENPNCGRNVMKAGKCCCFRFGRGSAFPAGFGTSQRQRSSRKHGRPLEEECKIKKRRRHENQNQMRMAESGDRNRNPRFSKVFISVETVKNIRLVEVHYLRRWRTSC